MHELVHLFLGNTGISAIRADNPVERFCNDVASAYLLPEEALAALVLGVKPTQAGEMVSG